MARRADPERTFEAQKAGVRGRLTGTGMQPETADRWLDAWVLEATGRGLRTSPIEQADHAAILGRVGQVGGASGSPATGTDGHAATAL